MGHALQSGGGTGDHPDGAALYSAIFNDCYIRDNSDPIEDYNQWYTVGGSQICQPDPDTTGGRLEYWFK